MAKIASEAQWKKLAATLNGKVSSVNKTTGTAYIQNEASGPIMKYIREDGTNAKFTLFDGSDGQKTMLQVYIGDADKANNVRLNGMLGDLKGLFYSTEATHTFVADDELATKGNVKTVQVAVDAVKEEIKDIEAGTIGVEETYDPNSEKAASGKAIADALTSYQEKLTAGTNITFSEDGKTINSTPYTAGTGLTLNDHEFSVDSTIATKAEVEAAKTEAQNTYATKEEAATKEELKDYAKTADIASAYVYKGSLDNLDAIQAVESPKTGDVYNAVDTGMNYAYTGEAWDALGATIDTSEFATKTELATKQDKLEAGTGITIEGNTISADTETVATKAELADYQKKLIAGTNITIADDGVTISAQAIDEFTDAEWKAFGFTD